MDTIDERICAPLHCTISITGYCNLDCVYCYAKPFSQRHIPLPDLQKILLEFKQLRVFIIKIAGGEPLLHPNIIEILDFVGKEEIPIALLTNLALPRKILEPIFDVIAKNPNIRVQVSLDDSDPSTNDLTRGNGAIVQKNIEWVVSRGHDIQIASVISSRNVSTADRLIDFYYPLVRRFHFMNIMPSVILKDSEEFRELTPKRDDLDAFWKRVWRKTARLPHKIVVTRPEEERTSGAQTLSYSGCSAGLLFCDIDDQQNVVACNMARDFVLGNLCEATFAEIWSSVVARKTAALDVALCHTHIKNSRKVYPIKRV